MVAQLDAAAMVVKFYRFYIRGLRIQTTRNLHLLVQGKAMGDTIAT